MHGTPSSVHQAVILAAGVRTGFNIPVALLEIEETTVIERQIEQLREAGIERIAVVAGYRPELFQRLESDAVSIVYSERYKWTGTMYSLSLARPLVDRDFLLLEGDLVFEGRALYYLLAHPESTCLLLANESGSGDEALVELRDDAVFKISKDIHQLRRIDGEFIGMSKLSLAAFDDMLTYFSDSDNPYLNYEYALLSVGDRHHLAFTKADDMVWAELDTPHQYETFKFRTYPKLKRREADFQIRRIAEKARTILGTGYEITGPIEKMGGMNNHNYKIPTNRGDYVFRMPGKGTEESVNREQEYKNSVLTFELGLDCETMYFDVASGLKITKYIDNAETLTVASAKREPNMALMARGLRRLHDSGRLFERTFDPFENIAEFERAVYKREGLMFEDYDVVKRAVHRLRQELEARGLEYVPCHLDAWPENFVKSGRRIFLIDWEYSGNYDRLWDVVSIGLECGYSSSEEELFLKKYFDGPPDPGARRKMDILRILMDVHWSLWALAKVSSGDEDLYDYSRERYERGKENLRKYEAMYHAREQIRSL